MPTRQLPARPNLEHLKKQARLLLRESLQGDAAAAERLRDAGVQLPAVQPKLADALHAIAREYGFDTWSSLKGHVESSSEDPVEALTGAVRANDAALVRQDGLRMCVEILVRRRFTGQRGTAMLRWRASCYGTMLPLKHRRTNTKGLH